MTNQIGDNKIEFADEQDRWLTMARCAVVMTTAKSADERLACVETVLDKFRDVPNQQPSRQDTAAYARFAARTFMEALIKSEAKHESENVSAVATENVSAVATENVFNEWIDEWLPPSHAPELTLSRM